MSWHHQFITQYKNILFIGLTYFVAWSVVDVATIFSGLSYDGTDSKSGKVKFNRYSNCDEYKIWSGYYIKKIAFYWNQTIQYWMKKYVYMRIVSKGEDPPVWKFLFVFLISAFWHGFYPSYYFFFLTYAIWMFISGEIKYVYSHKFRFLPG